MWLPCKPFTGPGLRRVAAASIAKLQKVATKGLERALTGPSANLEAGHCQTL
jgi:hypothetical protein